MKQSILFEHINSIVAFTETDYAERMYKLTRLPTIVQFINDNNLPVMGSNLYIDGSYVSSTATGDNSDDSNNFSFITVYTNSKGSMLADTLFNKLCVELLHEPIKYYPELTNSDLYTYDLKLHFSTIVRFIALNDEHFRRVRDNNCVIRERVSGSYPFKYVVNPELYLTMVYKDLCNPMEKHVIWRQRYNEMLAIESIPIGMISGTTDITIKDIYARMNNNKFLRMREQLLNNLVNRENVILIGQYALYLLLNATTTHEPIENAVIENVVIENAVIENATISGGKKHKKRVQAHREHQRQHTMHNKYNFDFIRPTVEIMTNTVADTVAYIKELYPSATLKTYDSNNEFRMFKTKTAIIENGTVLYEIYDSSDDCLPFNTVPYRNGTFKIGSPHLLLQFMYINVTNSYLVGYRERIRNSIELLKALRVWYLQTNGLNGIEESPMKVLHRTCMGRQMNSEHLKKIKKWNGELKLRYNKKCNPQKV
jgi:hypothetical protein